MLSANILLEHNFWQLHGTSYRQSHYIHDQFLLLDINLVLFVSANIEYINFALLSTVLLKSLQMGSIFCPFEHLVRIRCFGGIVQFSRSVVSDSLRPRGFGVQHLLTGYRRFVSQYLCFEIFVAVSFVAVNYFGFPYWCY